MPDDTLADPNELSWHAILVEFVAANDSDSTLWSERETLAAQNFFAHHQHGMPSIDQFIALFGKEAFDAALQAIFSEKKFMNDIRGINHPCHSCGTRDNLNFYEFGLLRPRCHPRPAPGSRC